MYFNQRKCKNCGASIEKLYNHKCPYCRSFIDFNIDKVEEINPRYMYDVEVVDIFREPKTNRMVMYFKGKYLKASEALEYTHNGAMVKIDYESNKPKDIMYAVSFDLDEFYQIVNQHDIRLFLKHFPFEMDTRVFVDGLMRFLPQFFGGRL